MSSSVPPEATVALLAMGEQFLKIVESAINRQADVRLAEIAKLESADYVALDAIRQSAMAEAARITAAASVDVGKVFVSGIQAEAARVRARHEVEVAERSARDARASREREAFRRSASGRFQ